MKNLKQKFALRKWVFSVLMLCFIGILYFGFAPDKVAAGIHAITCSVIFLAGVNLTEKSLSELKELRSKAQQKLENLVEKAKAEKRNLTTDEVKERDDLAISIRSLKNEIEIKEIIAEERQQRFKRKNSVENDFSLIHSIRDIISGSHSKELDQINERGRKIARDNNINVAGQLIIPLESRALQATDETGIVGTNVIWDFVTAFRNTNILVKAGAKYITGMVTNSRIPRGNGVSVFWENENDISQEGSNTFGSVTFVPKRLTAKVTVSKQLILQTGGESQKMLFEDIIAAVNSKVEETVFGKHAHDDKIPDGIFTGKGDSDLVIKGAIDRAKLLDIEFSLTDTDKSTAAFVINEKGAKNLKSTLKITGYPSYLLEDGKINDNPVFVTDHIPGGLATAENEEGIVFGDFKELIIGQFGLLDIVVDPYSKAEAASVVLTINAYYDFKVRNTGAFAIGSMLLPA